MQTSSIYAQTLGPSFTALAPVLQRLHGTGLRRLSGGVRLATGSHPFVRPLLWLAGLPDTPATAACELCLVPNQQGECWRRYFGRWRFITRQRAGRSNATHAAARQRETGGEILERFGPFTVHLRLAVKGHSLWVRSISTSLFGIAVPALLGIKVVARERPIDENSFHCDIQIRLPWLGRLLRYRGTLQFQRGQTLPHFTRQQRAMKGTVILRLAGAYNLAYGLLLAFFPAQVFHWLGMPQTPSIMIQAIGMMVGVYGLAYWIAGSDPVRYWPLVVVGLIGKTLGPIGFAAGLLQGVFVWKSATMFVFNDLIWWWPFWWIVKKGKKEDNLTVSPE